MKQLDERLKEVIS